MIGIEKNSIYLKDCIQGMKDGIEDQEIDVIVTSPPYNLNIKYGKYDDSIPRDQYLKWIDEVAAQCHRVLNDKGSFFLNVGYSSKDPWVAWEVAFVMRKYFVLQNTIHWIKSIAISKNDVGVNCNVGEDIAVGHFKPINSKRYINKCHEYIFHFSKNGDVELDKFSIGVPYQDKTNIGRWGQAKNDVRDRGDTWFIPYDTIRSRSNDRPHPASYPPKLVEMCIKLHGINGTKLVLDPFMGLGSTAIACIELGVDFIGFEIDEDYQSSALDRINDKKTQSAQKIDKEKNKLMGQEMKVIR